MRKFIISLSSNSNAQIGQDFLSVEEARNSARYLIKKEKFHSRRLYIIKVTEELIQMVEE